MDFDNKQPIYLQICDSLCEQILSGELQGGNRIPSVRELGGMLQVNPNTIMRSYEHLTAQGIIYNKRGVGYFVADNARATVLKERRERFFSEELPRLKKYIELIEIDKQQIIDSLR